MNAAAFFVQNYETLRRPHTPMKWMERMFHRLIAGDPPSLVDLPTGAGKTDLIVIWLIALAWYAEHRGTIKAVPRRLVWVVNRRVLVQQVYEIAEKLAASFEDATEGIARLTSALRKLCQPQSEKVLGIVQLRGQRLDDREWSLDPTLPQLIIGTVDQIGSRLLFQGYGQGKWARPMHAALFGVDAWVCIDEAHLVPAFAITLRQVRELATRSLPKDIPLTVTSLFDQLPFWSTELSATPGLPAPGYGVVFPLEREDQSDGIIADRLLAKKTRRVLWQPQLDPKGIARALATKALDLAHEAPGSAIAVFCSKANDAKAVEKILNAKHKNRVLLVTGRIRGYERDRLAENKLFQRFRQNHTEEIASSDAQPVFLVGTSAAEVGLDADSSAIVCDFADLLTLIQRLGRLDRRGQLSRVARDQNGPPPTMIIIGGISGKTTDGQLQLLAEALEAAHPERSSEYSAAYFAGAPWSVVVGKENAGDSDEEDTPTPEVSDEDEGKKPGVSDAIGAATWQVLGMPTSQNPAPDENELAKTGTSDVGNESVDNVGITAEMQTERIPSDADPSESVSVNIAHELAPSHTWLNHPLAKITAGPVVVPPLTLPTLQRWAATTPHPSRFLPVHPWLYGLLATDEGTPLVGIAFRLEVDILQHRVEANDGDEDTDRSWERLRACLAEFPPLRSELHFVPLDDVRKWLSDPAIPRPAMVHFDGDEWRNDIKSSDLRPDSVLLLPTSANSTALEDIIPKTAKGDDSAPTWDVFNAVASEGARYRRTVETNSSRVAVGKPGSGAYQLSIDKTESTEAEEFASDMEAIDSAKWEPARIVLRFSAYGVEYTLRYWKPRRTDDTSVSWLNDHLNAASSYAEALAGALAPSNIFIGQVLAEAGKAHDLGKDHEKWQRAMGNTSSWRTSQGHAESVRIAKPVVEKAGSAGGYRHEWGTLWAIKDRPPSLRDTDDASAAFWRDLYLHLIAAHHGYFRPSMPDRGLNSPPTVTKQRALRLAAIERCARLQRHLGPWRLAYLESLLKVADVAASREPQKESSDED